MTLIQEHREDKQAKEDRKRLRNAKILMDVNKYGGVWETPEIVDHQLGKLKTIKAKKEAIKAQLKLRQYILAQSDVDKDLYKYSANKIDYNLQLIQSDFKIH